jgi:hypothetical protein
VVFILISFTLRNWRNFTPGKKVSYTDPVQLLLPESGIYKRGFLMAFKINPRWNFLFSLLMLASLFLTNSLEVSAKSLKTPEGQAAQAQAQAQLAAPAMLLNQADTSALSATTQDLLGEVSGAQIVAQDEKLSKFSRCLLDPGHQQAGDFIINTLKEMGFSPIVQTFQTAAARGLTSRNIIVRIPGANSQANHLITAHWDSSPTRTFPPTCNSLAPGANDNGSGASSLLEMARLLGNGQGRYTFRDDLELVWFDAEEFGWLGSQYFVGQWNSDRQVNPRGQSLGVVLNLDMVGVSAGKSQGEIWAVAQSPETQALAKEGLALAGKYLPGVKYETYTIGDLFPAASDPNRQSDHLSFWKAQMGTAIFLTEDVADTVGGDQRWHTPLDKLYLDDGSLRLDQALLADSTRVALLIAANRAGIQPGRYFSAIGPPFEQNWSKADRPVRVSADSGKTVGRAWLWGPQPNRTASEAYAEAPGGKRSVVYFDKARMEITQPDEGYVTNGLLVTEMSTGQLQLGDNHFEYRGSSLLQVAGDSNTQGHNQAAPTYTSFSALVKAGPGSDLTSLAVQATLSKSGQVGSNESLGGQAFNRHFVADTGHNIPDVFWDWFAKTGPVYDPQTDTYRNGPVFDWLSTVGLPLTEAYWVRTEVSGVEKDVLVQLFQRRVLTFTPANDPQWQVEMGNVGQHYLAWRYGN